MECHQRPPPVRRADRTLVDLPQRFRLEMQLDKIGRRALLLRRIGSGCKHRAAILPFVPNEEPLAVGTFGALMGMRVIAFNADGMPDLGNVGTPGCRGLYGFA